MKVHASVPPVRSSRTLVASPVSAAGAGRSPAAPQGVVLIITLVMLSVVTFMAVTFLAVSRRERVAVTVVEEQTRARLMAETAVARAQAEVVSRVIASSNLLNYGFFVSTNFISPYGFDAGLPLIVPNPTNVNYERTLSGGPMTADGTPWLRNIANLQYDPRPPVFFSVTNDPRVPLDFRFYLDLNRNGRFESNGLLPELGFNGQWLGTNGLSWRGGGELVLSNFFVGDPEWVGILQDPGLPHSPTNRFIGRMAYLVQPAGKSLDLNFIGNHALRINDTQLQLDGYYRNQGVGSWELNLAAFLRDLNTNVTTFYNYRGLAGPGTGAAAEDALSILRYRYGGDLRNLLPVGTLYGPQAANAFQADWIDGYSDGPAFTATNLLGLTIDDDLTPPNKPWSGSDNPRTYVDLQELFDTNKVLTTAGNAIWPARMLLAQNALSSYDRYTFYRLQSQMGTDSGAGELGKVNLNYNNTPPLSATNFVTWTPQAFFEAAANRLFVAARRTNIVRAGNNLYTNFYIGNALVRPGMSVTNILVHPYNEYTPEVHRLLQLAVNLYDATTNRADTAYPHLPTVLRPLFATEGDAIFIKGYEPVTNNARAILQSERILSLAIPAHRTQLASLERAIVYDVPFLIGAKKGLPNFNEFSLRNVAQVTRKLEVRKRTPADPQPFQTNLMYLLTLTNQFGLELWNSYTNPFPRAVRVQILGSYSLALIDGARTNVPLAYTNLPYNTNLVLNANQWTSNQFLLPILRPISLANTMAYQPVPAPNLIPAGLNTPFVANQGFYFPDWSLRGTNSFICAILDEGTGNFLDFVSLGLLRSDLYITRELAGRETLAQVGATTEPGNVWDTNRVGGGTTITTPMVGIENQMQISLGNLPVSDAQWRSYSQSTVEGQDKAKSIDRFRMFHGLTPLVYTSERERQALLAELSGRTAVQAPFSPTRKLYSDSSWQANDPLVHYLVSDLLDPQNRPDDPDRTNTVRFAVPPTAVLTNSNLGFINERYAPWGGNPNLTPGPRAYDNRVKDPLITRSDDWHFPTNKFPSLGWIGRVHRGTPWQTVYLKSGVISPREWLAWSGSAGTHPTNDWPLLEAFTTAANENAARGLLSVNQTNLAAWSAVLSGLSVLSNLTPATVVLNGQQPEFQEVFIQPDGPAGLTRYPQLRRIVEGINRTRLGEVTNNQQTIPVFNRLGRILATPELTVASPFLDPNHYVTDPVLERIPQQILSLLREDDPRFVVYAFGQALREAPNSLYLQAGGFNRLCTNYQVTAEYAAKAVIRIEGTPLNPRAVIESYRELPAQ